MDKMHRLWFMIMIIIIIIPTPIGTLGPPFPRSEAPPVDSLRGLGWVQWRTGHRDESRWASTEVGRSDKSHPPLDNLLAVPKWAGRESRADF